MDQSETPHALFVRVLKVEPKWAEILVENGLKTLEEVAYIPIAEFRSVDGLDEQQIQDWRARARQHLVIEAIGGGDEEDPLATDTVKPPKPMSGGSGAKLNDNDGR